MSNLEKDKPAGAGKSFKPKIVSANDLFDGAVVYLDGAGNWTRRIDEAAVAQDTTAADGLLASADQPGKVVGPYLLDVTLQEGRVQPEHFRERFRDSGPTLDARFARHQISRTPAPQDAADQGGL